jgi:hypothetical protein
MSNYNGSFQIVNYTGQEITYAYVQHTCFGTIATQTATNLATNAATAPQSFQSSDGDVDNWSIFCVLADGTRYVRVNKQCDYTDDDDGETVLVIFYPNNFTILTPQSSACCNNEIYPAITNANYTLDMIYPTGNGSFGVGSPLCINMNMAADEVYNWYNVDAARGVIDTILPTHLAGHGCYEFRYKEIPETASGTWSISLTQNADGVTWSINLVLTGSYQFNIQDTAWCILQPDADLNVGNNLTFLPTQIPLFTLWSTNGSNVDNAKIMVQTNAMYEIDVLLNLYLVFTINNANALPSCGCNCTFE